MSIGRTKASFTNIIYDDYCLIMKLRSMYLFDKLHSILDYDETIFVRFASPLKV